MNNRQALKFLLRRRDDIQKIRICGDNRIAKKADGTDQNRETSLSEKDGQFFEGQGDTLKAMEKDIEKRVLKEIKKFHVYEAFLKPTKGVGTITAGWILAEFDIHKATTVSKLWQYAGLNSGMVKGKERVKKEDGSFDLIPTNTMVRGDRMTAGFMRPYNAKLRAVLLGIMGTQFVMSQNDYAMEFYYPYKERLKHSTRHVGDNSENKRWCDVPDAHRDKAAKRYMVKNFLKDLYVAWRECEGLTVRAPYSEEYLGKVHAP